MQWIGVRTACLNFSHFYCRHFVKAQTKIRPNLTKKCCRRRVRRSSWTTCPWRTRRSDHYHFDWSAYSMMTLILGNTDSSTSINDVTVWGRFVVHRLNEDLTWHIKEIFNLFLVLVFWLRTSRTSFWLLERTTNLIWRAGRQYSVVYRTRSDSKFKWIGKPWLPLIAISKPSQSYQSFFL